MRNQSLAAIGRFDVLYDVAAGDEVPLPASLERLYGSLRFPVPGRPYVVANFVQTIDGVVSLGIPGKASGGPISGFNQQDRFLLALLRATADVVITGAGTLRSVPNHLWTAGHAYPELAGEFASLRSALGKDQFPLNVIVTASGQLDPGYAVLQQDTAPVLILTTTAGAKSAGSAIRGTAVRVLPVTENTVLTPQEILGAVLRETPGRFILSEAGPTLMGELLAGQLVDELFLTVAPQIAGRDGLPRPGIVSGRLFAPDAPRWLSLVSVRRGGDHLFLRYARKP